MSRHIQIVKGPVDRTREHVALRFGDCPVDIALVAPRDETTFVVEWLLDVESSEAEDAVIVNAVRQELIFYLIELPEPDPWRYAIYHCGTAANLYSSVHWSYCGG